MYITENEKKDRETSDLIQKLNLVNLSEEIKENESSTNQSKI